MCWYDIRVKNFIEDFWGRKNSPIFRQTFCFSVKDRIYNFVQIAANWNVYRVRTLNLRLLIKFSTDVIDISSVWKAGKPFCNKIQLCDSQDSAKIILLWFLPIRKRFNVLNPVLSLLTEVAEFTSCFSKVDKQQSATLVCCWHLPFLSNQFLATCLLYAIFDHPRLLSTFKIQRSSWHIIIPFQNMFIPSHSFLFSYSVQSFIQSQHIHKF